MALINLNTKVQYYKTERQIFRAGTPLSRSITFNLNKTIKAKVLRRLTGAVREEVARRLYSSKEYTALIGFRDLRGELGIPPGTALENIVKAYANSVNIEFTPLRTRKGKRLDGGIKIIGIDNDFLDGLLLPEASYVTETREQARANKRGELLSIITVGGERIPWLKWLLFEGTRILNYDFGVSFQIPEGYHSRTGLAVMIDIGNRKFGGGVEPWGIPEEYSGTQTNNWITRALGLNGRGKPIVVSIEEILTRLLSNLNK